MGERVDLVKHLANHVGCIYAEGEKRSVKGDGLDPFVGLELRDTQRMNMVITVICIAVCTTALAKLCLQLCILSGTCQILADLLRIE